MCIDCDMLQRTFFEAIREFILIFLWSVKCQAGLAGNSVESVAAMCMVGMEVQQFACLRYARDSSMQV